jgi:hypothetical protein
VYRSSSSSTRSSRPSSTGKRALSSRYCGLLRTPPAEATGTGSGMTVEAKRGRPPPRPLGGSAGGDGGSGGPPASPSGASPSRAGSSCSISSTPVRPTGAGGRSSAIASSTVIGPGAGARSSPSLARSISSIAATRSSAPPSDASHPTQRYTFRPGTSPSRGQMNWSTTTGRRQATQRDAYSSSMCCLSGTSTRRELASCANAASSTAASGAVRKAIAASWPNGLGSAATARMSCATARRAVHPMPDHGSRTVSPADAKAASSASMTLSAGEGRWRSRSANPAVRRGRTTWSAPFRSASVISG